MDYLTLFLLGISFGSFLSVVLYRLRTGDSALRGRSYCDHCRHKISWYDNIPLFSFLILRGKCRYCQKTIAIDYPMTELIIGIQFVWIYWLLKINFDWFNWVEGWYSLALLGYWLTLFSGSLAIAIYDWKYFLIPDQILIPLTILAASRLLISHHYEVLLTAFGAAGFLAVLYRLTKGKGMGWGDVKLGFLLGLVLGWPNTLIALFLAFLTGAIAGVILVLVRRKKLKSRIAFGPFLVLGLIIAKIWGNVIWQWYLNAVLL